MFDYDLAVIGAGHAGCEAAIAASRLGAKVLLCSLNLDNIALMPCNPAVGGPAKSNLVREIDALGGVMGIVTDATYVQMKILNSSKGPAVRALRAQSDKKEYKNFMRSLLESEKNITLKQTCITSLIIKDGAIQGIEDELGLQYSCGAVILTTGTSLEGKIYIGLNSYDGGRLAERGAYGLSDCLRKLGFNLKKLKTGTPARVDGRTIDYSRLVIQPGDKKPNFFSFRPNRPLRPQIPCYLTRTNAKTHEIIQANLDKSPMYQGLIKGIGPRYCPSIEDKIVRFAHNPSHHIFIEPEGADTYEVYVQGFSTSLPADVQLEMLRSLEGLENVTVIKPAYAVEYDSVSALELNHSLMTKKIKGLFNAGQINGTSGYEEAAAQGLIAGINAVKHLDNSQMVELERSSSYIGTLIDDLVTKDIDEPYRMLTSRSEYRLILRQDNADERLTPLGFKIGLVDNAQYERFLTKQKAVENEIERLKMTKLSANEGNNGVLAKYNEKIDKGIRLNELLKRPNVTYDTIRELSSGFCAPDDVAQEAEIKIKYEGYIKRQLQQIETEGKLEKIYIPDNIDYFQIKQISTESKEKLAKVRPKTLAQASRIGGVKPADISCLMVLIESRKLKI